MEHVSYKTHIMCRKFGICNIHSTPDFFLPKGTVDLRSSFSHFIMFKGLVTQKRKSLDKDLHLIAKNSFYLFDLLACLYKSTGRAIAVTPALASALTSALASALLKMLKFLVKVFMSLYLLKLWMNQVDTLHVGRYWSEVLCCTIMTQLGDLDDLTNFVLKFLVKVFISLYLLKLLMDQVDTLRVGRYWPEVLCCTFMTHLGDLEVKVTDLEILC